MKFEFDKLLFWDVDIESADIEKNARHIINRILLRGNIQDREQLKKVYGIEKIKDEIQKMKFLDKRTLNFCSFYFNIPKTKFRCYNTPQSVRKLWNF